MSDRQDADLRPDWPDPELLRDAFGVLVGRQADLDLDRAWATARRRYAERQRHRRRWRRVLAAATAVALVTLPLSARSDAVPALVARLQDTWLGGTLRNVREYLSPGSQAEQLPRATGGTPAVSVARYADVNAAQAAAGVPILVPGWLPPGARLVEVAVASVEGNPLRVELWYTLPKGYLLVQEYRVDGATGLGTMYDTDDAAAVPVSVAGVPGTLLRHRNGYVRVHWAVPGYALRVETTLDPGTALRVAASLGPAGR